MDKETSQKNQPLILHRKAEVQIQDDDKLKDLCYHISEWTPNSHKGCLINEIAEDFSISPNNCHSHSHTTQRCSDHSLSLEKPIFQHHITSCAVCRRQLRNGGYRWNRSIISCNQESPSCTSIIISPRHVNTADSLLDYIFSIMFGLATWLSWYLSTDACQPVGIIIK